MQMKVGYIQSVKQHGSGVGANAARDQIEQRAFPRAVGTDHTQGFTPVDREGDILSNL